jgi:hypothetical protein
MQLGTCLRVGLPSLPVTACMHTLRRLRNTLRNRRPKAQDVTRSPCLPLEIWELVLEALTDEALLTAALVCAAFNDRCIAIYLRRNNLVFPEANSTESWSIGSHLLSVFQLSRLTPQIHTLCCHFWAFRVLRDMKFLRGFIRRSHEITELRLSVPSHLMNLHDIDILFPYSQRALLTEFIHVIRDMVAKATAPVLVILRGSIYRVRPCNIAEWGLRYFSWQHITLRAWSGPTGRPLPIDDEERQIVGCLYSIGRITLYLDDMPQLEAFIPWVAILPALVEVEACIWKMSVTDAEGTAKASAADVLRAALPWVPNIQVH